MDKVLSIIIPTYNMEKYLRKCLDSLIVSDEKIEMLEVLVINDGSIDTSSKIAHEYETKYPQTFKVIDKENGGHGSCCNVGLLKAKGKYIRFLDSDDWVDERDFPLYLQLLCETDADLIQTNRVDELQYRNKRSIRNLYKDVADRVWDADFFNFDRFSLFITLHDSTFRTEVLRKANIVFTENKPFDDIVLCLKPLTAIHSIYCSNLCVYHYLLGRPGQSVNGMTIKKMRALINEYKKLIDSYIEFRDNLSETKIRYGDRFINTIIINEAYSQIQRSSFGKDFIRDWHSYIKGLPILSQQTFSYYTLYNHSPFPYSITKTLGIVIRISHYLTRKLHNC